MVVDIGCDSTILVVVVVVIVLRGDVVLGMLEDVKIVDSEVDNLTEVCSMGVFKDTFDAARDAAGAVVISDDNECVGVADMAGNGAVLEVCLVLSVINVVTAFRGGVPGVAELCTFVVDSGSFVDVGVFKFVANSVEDEVGI